MMGGCVYMKSNGCDGMGAAKLWSQIFYGLGYDISEEQVLLAFLAFLR